MGFMKKLKLLFIVQKPAGQIMDAVEEVKKTKKWIHFAATVLGIAASSAAAWSGYMDPQIYIVVTSALNAFYNIVRGADKADSPTVKGPFTTSEFWLSVVNETQKAVVISNTSGLNHPWIEYIGTVANTLGLILGQNLAARTIQPNEPPPPPER